MTPLEFIRPDEPQYAALPPLSPAVRVGNLVFVSGLPGFDRKGGLSVGDFPAQMRQAMANVGTVLREAGAGWGRVAKVNVLLTRAGDYEAMNRIYAEHFPDGRYPARTTAIVAALPRPDFLLEIECVAVIG
ncbi:reactive intermediate/imine deaminase [Roseomonas rosea]|uniref:Reactive intermediate/imine deaminase n=1 Tax=Muricoccus roseus TaxID=198092 RepID=A0A1M6R7H0_9PROT|nr:RidA family protein [Roseomonas rosea]SHK28278.1 reactive intermediate/imine deaminase [Roseomonas rosea]